MVVETLERVWEKVFLTNDDWLVQQADWNVMKYILKTSISVLGPPKKSIALSYYQSLRILKINKNTQTILGNIFYVLISLSTFGWLMFGPNPSFC